MDNKKLEKIKRQVTKKIQKEFKENITFYIDTREQENEHIICFLSKNFFKMEIKKLDVGDYSFSYKNKQYYNEFILERKKKNEFVGNMIENKKNENDKKTHDYRLDKEREKMKNFKFAAFVIEDANFFDLWNLNVRSDINKNALRGRLLSMENYANIICLGGGVLDEKIKSNIYKKLLEKNMNIDIEIFNEIFKNIEILSQKIGFGKYLVNKAFYYLRQEFIDIKIKEEFINENKKCIY